MKTTSPSSTDKSYVTRALEATIHVGIVLLILFWCFKISQPFIEVIAWGIIIAVAIHPGYERLNRMLGGRRRLVRLPDAGVGGAGEMQRRADALLDALWPLLRPGGRLLYVTCSLLPAENDQQVAAFRRRWPTASAEVRPWNASPAASTPSSSIWPSAARR